MKRVKILALIFFLFNTQLFTSCQRAEEQEKIELDVETVDNFQEILQKGVLSVVLGYNSSDYFIYKGQPMGFQLELLKKLTQELGLQLEIKVENNLEAAFQALESGKCNLIAEGLTVTASRQAKMDFTIPFEQTRQVLVQRKSPQGKLIRQLKDLADKKVYVQAFSSHAEYLSNLSKSNSYNIDIQEDSSLEVEQLIAQVAAGTVDYVISDENVARINKAYYPEIDIEMLLPASQNLAWAVKKGNKGLLTAVNSWFSAFRETKKYRRLYNKYFKKRQNKLSIFDDFHSIKNSEVSVYDSAIKQQSNLISWDWRLLASLIYQESRFNPKVKSWAGAYGLMQLMPRTAQRFGVDSLAKPKAQIKAGVKFLQWLDNQLINKVQDKNERIKFVMAAYNTGLGHVLDARRLAKKYGKNENIWDDNVAVYMLQKSNPKYYRDKTVKYGYARGKETCRYVSQIYSRYAHYKNVL